MTRLTAQPLTVDAFAPFGDVLDLSQNMDTMINAGKCARHHDRALLDFSTGRAGISLFNGDARSFPYALPLLERHPLGSQAFIPMNGVPMLVTVAEDQDGKPVNLRAFLTGVSQGINLHRGTWHGVLAPMGARGTYAVVDRVGGGDNLVEHIFDAPILIDAAKG